MLKTCTKCLQEKDVEEFHRNRSKPDGRKPWCKLCTKLHHDSYYISNKDKWTERRKQYIQRNKDYVLSYLREHPCVDCPESDILFLDFDHLTDKEFTISRMISAGYSLARLKREIGKCEVVCIRCHRIRTAQRGNWLRLIG
jgi:hypothetical protein